MKSGVLGLIIFANTIIFGLTVQGQNHSTCPNSNFSLGNFDDWVGYYGYVENPAIIQDIATGRHTIMNAPGEFDPYTQGELFTLPPGESHSARLGNDNVDAEAEQLRYTISVTEESNLFIYKYAVVLEDPGHLPEEQPSFSIEVADNSGKVIDPVCGYYYVYAQQGLPTWHSQEGGEVIWKDWTTVGIDLTPYTGQTITIVFTTRDCSLTGHFGYAYISAYCSKLQIVFGYCPNDTVATVTAPPGFSYLWANGNTGQVTTINNPYFGMNASCTLTSANGCKVTIQGTFKPTLVAADFDFDMKCEGTPVSFIDSSSINQNEITNWVWDFGDGSQKVANVQHPVHNYDSSGLFNATLIAYSTDGCPDTITKTVRIVPIPAANFTTYNSCSAKSTYDTIYFNEQVILEVPHDYDRYTWSTGNNTYSVLVTSEGWQKVTLENAGLCSTTDSVMMLYCYVPLSMPNAFSPNSDGKNDQFRPVTQPEKVSSFSMYIFDCWGRHIFWTSDISQGWDGTVQGKPAPLGVYTFNLSYENPSGETMKKMGIVTLLR